MRPQNIRANCPTCHGAEQERDICRTCRCSICNGVGDTRTDSLAGWTRGCEHCAGTGVSIPLTMLSHATR